MVQKLLPGLWLLGFMLIGTRLVGMCKVGRSRGINRKDSDDGEAGRGGL